MLRLPKTFLPLTLSACLISCVHPNDGKKAPPAEVDQLNDTDEGEPLDADDLGPGDGWDDIMSSSVDRFEPNPDIFFEDAVLTPERLKALPYLLQRAPDLAHLAVSRAVENPIHYQDGVFGLVGSTKFYVTTRERIGTYDRLYWVIVKVMSEKYGCFMVSKIQTDDKLQINCRDKRQIVVWRAAGRKWIQFYARQYDRDGYEIKVVKRRIVRIGDRPVL